MTTYVQKYNPSEFDVAGIANLLYQGGADRRVSDRVQLAQFETALVESNMRNLPYGHCDSVGVFQQRPSMGWCANDYGCLDIHHAQDEFLKRAINVDGKSGNGGLSAGRVAQKVQISAYPDRYDGQESTAKRAIADAAARVAAMYQAGGIAGTPGNGYWTVEPNGTVHAGNGAPFFGDAHELKLNGGVVGIAASPTGRGYWLVAADGGIFSFGDAQFYGSMGGKPLNKPVVGMAATPSGKGYWMVASDGGIFSFGDARFYGSMGDKPPNKPVVGMSPTPTGKGYWMVASDGGIFTFGDAQFYGSMGDKPLNKPVVGMSPTPTGKGYWMVASDGGIFTFGDAQFYGSGAGQADRPVSGMAATVDGGGYRLVENDGVTVLSFGNANASQRSEPATARISDTGPVRRASLVSVDAWDADESPLDLQHLEPGTEAEIVVNLRNDGEDTWLPVGEHPTRLATAGANGDASPFAVDGEWLSPSEPATVAATTAPPGTTVPFAFPIVVPEAAGDYSESFNLSQDGLPGFDNPDIPVSFHVDEFGSSDESAPDGDAGNATPGSRIRAHIRSKRLVIRANRRVHVRVGCPQAAGGSCRGSVAIRLGRGHLLGKAGYTIASGTHDTVVVRLKRSAVRRAHLRRRRAVTIAVTCKSPSGTATTRARATLVKAPA